MQSFLTLLHQAASARFWICGMVQELCSQRFPSFLVCWIPEYILHLPTEFGKGLRERKPPRLQWGPLLPMNSAMCCYRWHCPAPLSPGQFSQISPQDPGQQDWRFLPLWSAPPPPPSSQTSGRTKSLHYVFVGICCCTFWTHDFYWVEVTEMLKSLAWGSKNEELAPRNLARNFEEEGEAKGKWEMKKKESETAISRAPGQMTQLPVVSSTRGTTDEEWLSLSLWMFMFPPAWCGHVDFTEFNSASIC